MTIISCYDTLMFTDSSVNALLSNLRNYSDREVPKTPEIEALRKLDREATLDRSWWQKFFNPTKEELLEQIAEPTFVEKLIFNHPELVLGPASLGLSSLRTAGALALQRVAPRALALGSVAPLWENLTNYMKGGKDAVKKPLSSDPAPRTERVIPTQADQLKFSQQQKASGAWKNCESGGWRGSFESKKGDYRFTPTVEKWEFEVYKKVAKGWQHCGVMRAIGPEKGEILDRFAKGIIKK